MQSTPIRPPAIASSVIWSSAGMMSGRAACAAHMNSAGIVNSTPEATDELAEPTVWDMFSSRML